MATCACREPKSGRIGDAVRQPGRATRYVRAAEPGKKPAHPGPMIDAFSQYCNSERTLAESGADAGNASVICRAIASSHPDNDQNGQQVKADGRDHEQVTLSDPRSRRDLRCRGHARLAQHDDVVHALAPDRMAAICGRWLRRNVSQR
jgi:hypothetical protein